MLRKSLLLVAAAVSAAVGHAQSAANPAFSAPSLDQDVLPLAAVDALIAETPDVAAARLEDEVREAQGLAPRYALPQAVSITPATHGTWENLDAEHVLWRLRIAAPGARSINLGFGSYRMTEGGQLLLYSSDLQHVVRPFDAADNEDHGELWTPVLPVEEIVIELSLPLAELDDLELELSQIGYGYRGFATTPLTPGVQALSGSCNVDVICPDGDDWRLDIPSVGVISLGGGTFCTGFMVNNLRADLTPYFMTARHCGVTSGNASSLVVYWNYENTFCRVPGSSQSGQQGNGSLSQFNTGSNWRASYSPSDFTLVELDDPADPTFDLSWAGFDATGADAAMAIAIHHPNTQEKRISFEDQATTTTSYLGNSVPGDGTHVRVIDWDLGTTEGGSSGSPLFNQDHRVIGQLHGGFASCTSQTSDWYGKFSVSWNGGGTSTTSLKPWLDPDNTGLLTANTMAAVCPATSVTVSNGSGINPLCLASTNTPVIGGDWTIGIDTSVVAGPTFSVVRLYPDTQPGAITASGELLVNTALPTLAFSNLTATGGIDVHTISIPDMPSLAGMLVAIQGGVANATAVTLCNAEVVILGCE